jgi:hypothetical protein
VIFFSKTRGFFSKSKSRKLFKKSGRIGLYNIEDYNDCYVYPNSRGINEYIDTIYSKAYSLNKLTTRKLTK